MAENESLDLRQSPRWRKVYRVVADGVMPMDDLEEEFRKALYRTVRESIKQMRDCGVDFAEFLAAVESNADCLQGLVWQCHSPEFAELLADQVPTDAPTREIIRAALDEMWERLAVQFEERLVEDEIFPNFPEARAHLEEIRTRLNCDLDRIAEKLATNPTRIPRKPPRRRRRNDGDDLQELLGQSLIAG